MYMYTSLYTLSLIQVIFKVVDYGSFKFPFWASFFSPNLKKYLTILRSKLSREDILLRVKQKISGKTQTQTQVRS